MLKVNNQIEFLDIGHNRIRAKGLQAIAEGILGNKASPIKTLGLRMNFLSDDSIQTFFDEVIFSDMTKIENLYLTQNNISDYKSLNLNKRLQKQTRKMYIDKFEKIMYNEDERLERTLWFNVP